jgi:hypothetical protein
MLLALFRDMSTRSCTVGLDGLRIPICPTRQRLAQAFMRLRKIDLLREECGDGRLAKPVEERIVWRELLDLELQDIDERIAANAPGTANGDSMQP